MEFSNEDIKNILKNVLREKELIAVGQELELKEIENKEIIPLLSEIIDTGIKLYGAYQFGEFLGKVAHHIKSTK